MLRVFSLLLAAIALQMARSAFSHFVCSVVLGAVPQVQKMSSQLRNGEGWLAMASVPRYGEPGPGALLASVTSTELFLPVVASAFCAMVSTCVLERSPEPSYSAHGMS